MRKIVMTTIIGLSLPTSGCAVFHVYQADSYGVNERPIIGNNPGNEWHSETRNSILWGGVQQHLPVENCKLANGERTNIEEIVVRTDAEDALIALGTLGFWTRTEIRWRCSKPKVVTGTLRPETTTTTD